MSIVLVLLAHLEGTRHAPDLAWTHTFGDLGNLGVRIFFVISGFLMTMLLDAEHDRTGRISLIAFLQRRAYRILPAFGLYVGTMAALAATGLLALGVGDLVMAATFTMNYDAGRSWYVGHLWSLSVEAQFYVSWAVLRVLAGRKRMLLVAIAAFAIGPAARVAIHLFIPDWRWSIGEAFPTIVDALATGGLLAMLQGRLAQRDIYVRVLRARAFAAAPIALLALNAAMPHIAFSYTVGQTVMNLLIAVIVHRVVLFPQSAVGRVLNGGTMIRLGAISYSLYLWQQPFLNRGSASVAAACPLNVGLAIIAALFSYYVVERPALKLGHRITTNAMTQTVVTNRVHAHAAIS